MIDHPAQLTTRTRLMSRINHCQGDTRGVILSRVVNQVFKRTVTQHSSKCRFRLHPFSATSFFVQTGNSTFDDLHMRTKSRRTAIHVLQISPPSAIIPVARRTSRERAMTLLISLLGTVYQRLLLISAQVSSRRPQLARCQTRDLYKI